MKNIIEKIKSAYSNSRVFRTFIQSFAGYIVTNLAYVVQSAYTGGENVGKVLLYTLLIPAVSTALARIMNANKAESEGE